MATKVFEATDPISGDSFSLELDGRRVLVHSVVEGRQRLVVLVEPQAAERLARALTAALEGERGEEVTSCRG